MQKYLGGFTLPQGRQVCPQFDPPLCSTSAVPNVLRAKKKWLILIHFLLREKYPIQYNFSGFSRGGAFLIEKNCSNFKQFGGVFPQYG